MFETFQTKENLDEYKDKKQRGHFSDPKYTKKNKRLFSEDKKKAMTIKIILVLISFTICIPIFAQQNPSGFPAMTNGSLNLLISAGGTDPTLSFVNEPYNLGLFDSASLATREIRVFECRKGIYKIRLIFFLDASDYAINYAVYDTTRVDAGTGGDLIVYDYSTNVLSYTTVYPITIFNSNGHNLIDINTVQITNSTTVDDSDPDPDPEPDPEPEPDFDENGVPAESNFAQRIADLTLELGENLGLTLGGGGGGSSGLFSLSLPLSVLPFSDMQDMPIFIDSDSPSVSIIRSMILAIFSILYFQKAFLEIKKIGD